MTLKVKTKLDDKIKRRLEELELLKPFILKCLSLNHDINNPLAGVIGYLEFILSDPTGLTDDQVDLLNKVAACAERIKNQVADLGDAKADLAKQLDIKAILEEYSK